MMEKELKREFELLFFSLSLSPLAPLPPVSDGIKSREGEDKICIVVSTTDTQISVINMQSQKKWVIAFEGSRCW
jgi:hypothetical protein